MIHSGLSPSRRMRITKSRTSRAPAGDLDRMGLSSASAGSTPPPSRSRIRAPSDEPERPVLPEILSRISSPADLRVWWITRIVTLKAAASFRSSASAA